MNFFGENMNWVFSEINLNGKISPSIPMIIISLSMIFVILHRQIKNGFCYSPGTKKKIGRKLNKEKEKPVNCFSNTISHDGICVH